jgi:hypothetical protein
MKFNFNLKTIIFVLLILLFSVIFLYNMMPSYMEGFKEGNEIPVDMSGNPLVCEMDPSGDLHMVRADGTLHTDYTYNDIVYKCDASGTIMEVEGEEQVGEEEE